MQLCNNVVCDYVICNNVICHNYIMCNYVICNNVICNYIICDDVIHNYIICIDVIIILLLVNANYTGTTKVMVQSVWSTYKKLSVHARVGGWGTNKKLRICWLGNPGY